MTAPIIVADASPLIGLAKLDQLRLLTELFSTLHVPQMVYSEVVGDQLRVDARLLRPFLDEYSTLHFDLDNAFTQEVSRTLDAGEIQAMALARQFGCGVMMDELRGRKVAQRYDIQTVGILGVLMQAKLQGFIPEVAPLIVQLQAENYRLSIRLVDSVLKRMGEI